MNIVNQANFYVVLIFLTEIVMWVYAYRKTNGDLVSPSVMTLSFFILSFACFLYNTDQWVVVFTFKAYMLYALTFAIMLGLEFFWRNRNRELRLKPMRQRTAFYIAEPLDTILFVIFTAFSLIYVYRVYKSGMSLGASSFLMAIGFNKEEGDFDGLSRLLYNMVRMASYVYAIIFCQNVIAARQSVKQNWKSLVIIIVTVINTFFSGQRSATIAYLIGIFVAVMIAVYDRPKRRIYKKKVRRSAVYAGLLIVTFFFLSANFVKGNDKERIFTDYMTYYFGCTNASMGRIVEKPTLCHTPFRGYFGEKTFNGFWKDMYSRGIVKREPCDRVWIPMHAPATIQATNEYSFLCAPYIDFGFWGALVFVFCFYCLYDYLYYEKILIRDKSENICSISAIYIFLYAMVAMTFYQDTIRSYSRPINILYLLYIFTFCKLFVNQKAYVYKLRSLDNDKHQSLS